MGTSGYKVYRQKGRYFLYYNHSGSYPELFGLDLLHGIPHDMSEFEDWLKLTREMLDARYEELKNLDDLTEHMSDKPPDNDLLTDSEWIYEIDLDNLVFHVDSQPLFRLDNM